MRLLVVTQHYWPEPFSFSDICEGLVERGHEVTVLTGLPNYPEGEVYAGYESAAGTAERRNGVLVVRVALHPRKTGALHRAWNYYSFPRNAARALGKLPGAYDAVLSFQTSPVMMAQPAIAASEAFGAPLLIWCIDIWPECLAAGGIRRGSALFEHYRRVARRVYSAADVLAVTSPAFEDYLRAEVTVDGPSWLYLPQYAEDVFAERPAKAPEGYGPGEFHVTFAGNVGTAQSVQTAVRAAALLPESAKVRVHVVGAGSELDRCVEEAGLLGARAISFHGRRPLEDMPAFYQASDAMLVTFADEPALALTLPRKMQTYLAAGKPVVVSGGGEARRVVEDAGCGVACAPEDYEALAGALVELSGAPRGHLASMGRAARSYYDENYTKRGFFARLEGALIGMKGERHGH